MRKILATKNIAALSLLHEFAIAPLLATLVEAKINQESVATASKKLVPPMAVQAVNALLRVSIAKKGSYPKGSRLVDYCESLVLNCSLATLQRARDHYALQYLTLTLKIYSVAELAVPAEIRTLFVDLLYTKCFDAKGVWEALGKSHFTRSTFHENFRADNDYPAACPYCDLDTMNSGGTHVVEHFLPKSRYPYLALHPINLFSACHGCNGAQGKGSKVIASAVSPLIEEIGQSVEFAVDDSRRTITASATTARPEVSTYIELLRLDDRYAEVNTWIQFDRRRNAFLESIQGGHSVSSCAEAVRFAEVSQGGAVLTFAILAWVKGPFCQLRSSPSF